MDIQRLIKSKRTALGLTMKELAAAVGVSESTISRWESGEISSMRHPHIVRLARALQVTPAAIMGWEDEEPEKSTPRKAATALSQTERELLKPFRRLNDSGQSLVVQHAEALDKSGSYTRESSGVLELEDEPKAYDVPISARAAAGYGIDNAYYYGEDTHAIERPEGVPEDAHLIEVRGDSMEPDYPDGSFVWAVYTSEPVDGAVFIVDYEGDTFIKRLDVGDDGLRLVSINTAYAPIVVRDADFEQLYLRARVIARA